MRTGLCVAVLISFGCAGSSPTATSNLTETSPQDPCASRLQQSDRGDIRGRSCHDQHAWWNDVGNALSGAATAVRLPHP